MQHLEEILRKAHKQQRAVKKSVFSKILIVILFQIVA